MNGKFKSMLSKDNDNKNGGRVVRIMSSSHSFRKKLTTLYVSLHLKLSKIMVMPETF